MPHAIEIVTYTLQTDTVTVGVEFKSALLVVFTHNQAVVLFDLILPDVFSSCNSYVTDDSSDLFHLPDQELAK